MSADESLFGLLLRAHAAAAAQAHGEEFLHRNVPAMCDFETAKQSIASAIRSVAFAETRQAVQQALKEKAK